MENRTRCDYCVFKFIEPQDTREREQSVESKHKVLEKNKHVYIDGPDARTETCRVNSPGWLNHGKKCPDFMDKDDALNNKPEFAVCEARRGNRIAHEAKEETIKANNLSHEANKIARTSNDIACEAKEAVRKANKLAIISIGVAIFSATAAIGSVIASFIALKG